MQFSTSRAILYFAVFDLAIVASYGIHVAMDGWPNVTDLDRENNLGAWWGGAKFIMAGCALACVPLLVGTEAPAGKLIYGLLAIGFVFLSADEILAIHEKITEANKSFDLGIPMFEGTVSGNAHAAWIFVYGVSALGVSVLLYRNLRRLIESDPMSATVIITGMAILVLGAVGVEVAGYYASGLLRFGSPTQVALEEGLELVGVSIILVGCLRHLVSMVDEARPWDRVRDPSSVRANYAHDEAR